SCGGYGTTGFADRFCTYHAVSFRGGGKTCGPAACSRAAKFSARSRLFHFGGIGSHRNRNQARASVLSRIGRAVAVPRGLAAAELSRQLAWRDGRQRQCCPARSLPAAAS